ncbi:glycosyltransferase family 2 protein [Solimonas sp. K1W22B-7]|uniref:glycosyltransferase family 2 protein n=1 Tax=Solimonas sp. K1W22B-7 TaxID=2303331 RepID=UPI000E331901|nr:glycosyltransferase family 2 protein [Solimonas sp. K1W22B-7]AXQ31796.1 glycosyltransferase family 2 protein [Solimonas sp. K1W22B-7]
MNTALSESTSRSILEPQDLELTILMPCLDEAETVATCVKKARRFLDSQGIAGEVLVADNGSTDGSQELAFAAGARVEHIAEKGYGSALLGGIRAARGRYVIMGDADDSYDFSRLTSFIDKLRDGHAMVVGNRFQGGIEPGAMPFLHRYLGNPVLSFVGRLFFGAGIGDFHCGLRGFDRNAILGLSLQSSGMEFASEMIVKTTLAGLSMAEVPTTLAPAGRTRPPHLRSWRDGWRHLRFLLMMSPRWLFLYPGMMLIAIGLLAQLMILQGPIVVRGVGFDIHTMLYASAGTVLGVQLIVFALLARAIGHLKQVLPPSKWFNHCLRLFSLERGILLGLLVFGGGLSLALLSVNLWLAANMSTLDPASMMRVAIPSVTFMLTGAEIVFASFILSFIDVKPCGKM